MKRSLRLSAASLTLIAITCGVACVQASNDEGAQQTAQALTAPGQVIADMNALTLAEILKNNPLNGNIGKRSRQATIVMVTIYEAVNSVRGRYKPYASKIENPRGTSAAAAALSAAHGALVGLFPVDQALLDARLAADLANLPDAGKADGVTLGQAAANAILSLRSTDFADSTMQWGPGDPLWTANTGLGLWVPTPPSFAPMMEPNWAFVTPWVLKSASQYRADAPPALTDDEYTTDYNEVKSLGAINSTTRTADQTDAANFWYDPSTLPWNQAAQQMTVSRNLSIEDSARVFALLNLGLADAQIAVFDSKEFWATAPGLDTWRPVTAIQQGDNDSNPDTVGDPTWAPLRNTPAHPDFPSGHLAQSGAGRTIMNYLFHVRGRRPPTDISLDLSSAAGRLQNPPILRHFASFDDMTDEVFGARTWAGIHTRHADAAGEKLGDRVGRFVARHSLRPADERDDGHGCDDEGGELSPD